MDRLLLGWNATRNATVAVESSTAGGECGTLLVRAPYTTCARDTLIRVIRQYQADDCGDIEMVILTLGSMCVLARYLQRPIAPLALGTHAKSKSTCEYSGSSQACAAKGAA
jgi:hypothetical protein